MLGILPVVRSHLFPLALLTAVHVYRDGVLVGADDSLNVILLKCCGKILERKGPILQELGYNLVGV